MSAERSLQTSLTILLLAAGGPAFAAEDEVPDMEFLEYLGMWEESDKEWLALEEPLAKMTGEPRDPVPEGEESTEKDDES